MNNCFVLFKMRMQQQINHSFRFRQSGWLVLVIEFSLLGSLIAMYSHGLLQSTPLLFWPTLFIMIGNGYLNAVKMLYCEESKLDIVVCEKPLYSFVANYSKNVVDNLRVSLFFPIVVLLLAGQIYALPFLLALPIAGSALAIASYVLIQRYLYKWQNIFYVLYALLYIGGIVVALLLLFGKTHIISGMGIMWLFTVLIIIILFSWFLLLPQFARVWHYSFIRGNSTYSRAQKGVLLRNGILAKEYILLWRHPLSLLRIILYCSAIVIVSLLPVSVFGENITPLFLLVWLVCFGELPATAWQNDGARRYMPWLAGKSADQCVRGRFFWYIVVVLLGVLGYAIFSRIKTGILLDFGLLPMLLLLGSATMLAMAVSSLGYGRESNAGFDQVLLEQVPYRPSSMMAFIVMLIYLFAGCRAYIILPWYAASLIFIFICAIAYLLHVRILQRYS